MVEAIFSTYFGPLAYELTCVHILEGKLGVTITLEFPISRFAADVAGPIGIWVTQLGFAFLVTNNF